MKKTKKSLILFIILIITMTLTACKDKEEPIPEKPLELPTTESIETKDETIYTILDDEGQLVSMKAVNRISNVSRNYYLDYGQFSNIGNNNLSFAAPILINEGIAKIPSLKTIDNFYYELNLKTDYYYSRLPYDIKISYKLNNQPISAKNLVNQSGEVVIILDVDSNIDTEQYFKNSYMAQIQVPININNNKIIDSSGSNAVVLVGSTANVAYTVMPGKNAHYELKIESKGFKFNGIQATFQPFSYSSLFNNVNIDMEEYFNKIELIIPAINEISDTGFSPLINSTQPLFTNLPIMINQISTTFVNENIINQLNEIQNLDQLKNLFIAPVNLVNQELSNHVEIINQLSTLYQSLEVSLEDFIIKGDALNKHLNQLVLKSPEITNTITGISNNYQYLIDASNKLNTLKSLFEQLQPLFNNQDLISFVKDLDEYIDIIAQIKVVKYGVENDLAMLVKTMTVFSTQITPILEDIINLFNYVNDFLRTVEPLKLALNEYGSFIKNNQYTYFNTDVESQTAIGTCLGVIYGDGDQNIGLIEKLILLQNEILQYNLEDYIEQIELLGELLTPDENTKLRPIDQISLGFVELNNALSVSSAEEDLGFFSGIDMIVGNLTNLLIIKSLVPAEKAIPVSFLSSENQQPNSIQFVIKQLPIS